MIAYKHLVLLAGQQPCMSFQDRHEDWGVHHHKAQCEFSVQHVCCVFVIDTEYRSQASNSSLLLFHANSTARSARWLHSSQRQVHALHLLRPVSRYLDSIRLDPTPYQLQVSVVSINKVILTVVGTCFVPRISDTACCANLPWQLNINCGLWCPDT